MIPLKSGGKNSPLSLHSTCLSTQIPSLQSLLLVYLGNSTSKRIAYHQEREGHLIWNFLFKDLFPAGNHNDTAQGT